MSQITLSDSDNPFSTSEIFSHLCDQEKITCTLSVLACFIPQSVQRATCQHTWKPWGPTHPSLRTILLLLRLRLFLSFPVGLDAWSAARKQSGVRVQHKAADQKEVKSKKLLAWIRPLPSLWGFLLVRHVRSFCLPLIFFLHLSIIENYWNKRLYHRNFLLIIHSFSTAQKSFVAQIEGKTYLLISSLVCVQWCEAFREHWPFTSTLLPLLHPHFASVVYLTSFDCAPLSWTGNKPAATADN